MLITNGLGMGGAERVIVDLADGLVNRGHEVEIVCLIGSPLVLPINRHIKVIAMDMQGYKDIPICYLKLRKLINDFKPDVVHSHMPQANMFARLLRLSTKIPKLISTAHNTNEGGRSITLAYRITDRLADISTNVSNEAVSTFIQKGAVKPGRMVSIANGIDVEKFFFDKTARQLIRDEFSLTDKKMLIAVGSMSTQKDYPNLLNAINILNRKRQDFKLFIVGDGALRADLEQLTKTLNIDSVVEFLGIRRDITSLMSAADIFVLSSAWEGFGLVVAEAMACERVVVVTDCGGVAEVVGDAGIIVEPRNAEQLATEIDKALDMNAEESSTLGHQARQRITDNYSLERNINAYLALYNN